MQAAVRVRRKKGMDALRGIGITGIVLFHLFPSVFPGGFLGVPLFFILSGYFMFVTSETEMTEGGFHIGRYYRKRAVKILPSLYIMVMAVCAWMTLFRQNQMAGIRGEVSSIFLGCENWWKIQQNTSYFSKLSGGSPFTHLWFLAIEIQFYLLWPALFLLYKKGCEVIGGKKMCFLFLILALLSAARMFFLYTPGGDPSRVYYGTDTMAFPLLTGMFLGAFRRQFPQLSFSVRQKESAMLIFASFIFIFCILFVSVDGRSDFVYQGGMFWISVLFAVITAMVEDQGDVMGDRLERSLISWIGRKSYLIYLWHYPVIILISGTFVIG